MEKSTNRSNEQNITLNVNAIAITSIAMRTGFCGVLRRAFKPHTRAYCWCMWPIRNGCHSIFSHLISAWLFLNHFSRCEYIQSISSGHLNLKTSFRSIFDSDWLHLVENRTEMLCVQALRWLMPAGIKCSSRNQLPLHKLKILSIACGLRKIYMEFRNLHTIATPFTNNRFKSVKPTTNDIYDQRLLSALQNFL